MKRIVTAAVAVALIWAGVHYASTDPNGPSLQVAAPGGVSSGRPERSAGEPLVRSACLDETGSTSRLFHEAILKALVERLRSWYPEETLESGAPSTPALDLSVFPVTRASTDYGVQPFRAQFPGLDGLSAMPTKGGDISAWLINKQTWLEERQKDIVLARQGALALANYRFAAPDSSGIGTCLSAVAVDLGGQAGARIAFFSDLDNTSTVQQAGSLRAASVVVAQPCNKSVAACRSDYAAFAELAKRMGVTSVSTANPKNPDQAVSAWLDH